MEMLANFAIAIEELKKVNNEMCLENDNLIMNLKRKRKLILKKICNLRQKRNLLIMMLIPNVPIEHIRSQGFWERDCQLFSDEQFKSHFRMSRTNFKKLCLTLKNMYKEENFMKKLISFEKRIAISLYTLGSSSNYRSIANLFGVGKATVCVLFLEFCKEIWNKLKPIYLNDFPLTAEKIENLTNGFNKLGFPQCIGAIGSCHIKVNPRVEDATDYYNCAGWCSNVLLALVDSRYRFVYINVGNPGRCNDSEIYEKSLLKQELSKPTFCCFNKSIKNKSVPLLIIGDSAFRFSEGVMKPYAFSINLTQKQKIFNQSLFKCRKVVENAFVHIKARFRRIGKGIDNSIENSNKVIKACCVLHNFLNTHNDEINSEWIFEQAIIDRQRQQPYEQMLIESLPEEAEEIRSAIADYLCDIRPVSVDEGDMEDLCLVDDDERGVEDLYAYAEDGVGIGTVSLQLPNT